MCVAKEFWGLDPNSGKLRWYAGATGAEQAYSSAIFDGARVFAVTGRGGGSIAVDAGGKGNISATNTVWSGSVTASFGSPVKHKANLYVISNNVLTVIDCESGKRTRQLRLRGAERTGGRFGSLDYPSPIVVGNHLFYLNGSGQTFVFELGDELTQVALNRVTDEKEFFGGTPAVSNGRLILRSSKNLYCVTDQGDKVAQNIEAPVTAESEGEAGRGGGRGGRSGQRRFDPMSFFTRMDTNKDGKLTADELEETPLAERMDQLDKDGDKAVTQEEFRTGMAAMFSRGRGGSGTQRKDTRPDRPQRPEMAD
jgi:hypothetical protein